MKKRKNLITLILSIAFFIVALLVILYTLVNRTPQYNNLEKKEAIVESFYVNSNYKTSDDAVLITADGDKFYIRGEYEQSKLCDKLKEGNEVQIKFYKRKAFYIKTIFCAEELTVDNEKICTYKNYDIGNIIGCIIAGCVLFGLSVLLFIGWRRIKK